MMLENILYSLNELSLLIGISWMLLQYFLDGFTTKDYFRTTKIAILASVVFSILFYNKNILPEFFEVTSFTVLFYSLTAAIAFAWVDISFRWFTSEEMPSCRFCVLVLMALLCFNVVISTINLGVLCVGLLGLIVINYNLLRFSQENEELHPVSRGYGWSATFVIGLMFMALYILMPQNWSYAAAAEYISTMPYFYALLVAIGILFVLLFMLAIAPLHFWFSDVVTPAVLPVAAYFVVVPFFTLWGVFIKINWTIFLSVIDELRCVYVIFGVLSIALGAIGANTSRNLRKIFAFGGLYNVGVILLLISPFTPQTVLSAFIYMQVYILAIFGIYTSFYSFKSNGGYLSNVSTIGGIYQVRPFISAAVLFFMVSLMGIAPLPGFLGQIAALYNFAEASQYWLIFVVLSGMLVLMIAYLQIIRMMYFGKRELDFDRPDFGVYVYLFINMLLIGILVFKPQFLLNDAEIILSTVLR